MEYKCLFADDDEKFLRLTEGVIRRRWREEFGGELEVVAKDFEAAEELLKERPADFQLVITDLMEIEEDGSLNPRGHGIVEAANEHGIALIAITKYVDEGGPAEEAGAVLVSKTRQRRDVAGDYLRGKLREAVERAGLAPVPTEGVTVSLEDNPYLPASLYTVGEDVLKALVVKHLGEVGHIQVGFVRSGLSGATVFRCTVDQRQESGSFQQDLLLKVSRDGGALKLESLRQDEEVRALSGSLFPRTIGKPMVEHMGWCAIATEYEDGGETLADWLLTGPSEQEVGEALGSLFLEPALAKAYGNSSESIADASPLDLVLSRTLTASRKARIRLAARALAPLAEAHGGASAGMLQVVETFLESGRVVDRDEETVATGAFDVRAHGDLHARNVLIGRNRRAVLIDPANIDRQHWPADWARLVVDVFLGGLEGSDPIQAYGWERLAQWVDVGDSLVDLSTDGLTTMPDGPRAALGWLLESREEIYAGVLGPEAEPPIGELQLALAAELLRGAYRLETLTAPVRTLALMVGRDALEAAAVNLPRRSDDRAAA